MGPDFRSEQLEGEGNTEGRASFWGEDPELGFGQAASEMPLRHPTAIIGKAGDKKAGNVCKQLSPGEKTESMGSSGLLSPAWLCD